MKLTCIACPLGCSLTVEKLNNVITVSGNGCAKGEEYATEEILAPKRTVTATVALLGGELARLPVRTDSALPKELIGHLLRELYGISVTAPVSLGDSVLIDFRGTGINLVATRRCAERGNLS